MCQFTGWFTAGTADRLFREFGYEVDKLRKDAAGKNSQDFLLISGSL
jgi:hypothetical protein